MTDLLFIYGTLLQPGNPFADYLHRNCTVISSGKIRGTLYDIGEYPGLVLNSAATAFVHGTIVRLHHPHENLKIIDDYEGVGPGQEQPNLYTREPGTIETDSGLVTAWIYLYNLPIDGLPIIASGNYLDYKAQKKSPGS
ncbi:gamma-glutamylcyclotransferase [Mucilaginibacter lutimaris]|uniref:Gamma-glutamylcyclotransferase n=1 Tax=Mucilaginibacter lutimaris TaxID=931629 RepID=A0ABW2ZMA0_9SPHI